MSRNTWDVYIEVGTSAGGSAWSLDGTIYRPNASLSLSESSTTSVVRLFDGGKSFFHPPTKYLKDQMVLNWKYVDDTFLSQLQNYCENRYKLKIVTHVTGREFIGYFLNITPVWLEGVEGNKYDIDAVFEPSE